MTSISETLNRVFQSKQPTCYPRDVPAAKPGLEASSKATLKSLRDLTDPTSACYSAVGHPSSRELALLGKGQRLDTLRLASSQKAINVVQSTAESDTLHLSPTVVSAPRSHLPGLADEVVFKASRHADLLRRCPGENHQASKTECEITNVLPKRRDGHDRPAMSGERLGVNTPCDAPDTSKESTLLKENQSLALFDRLPLYYRDALTSPNRLPPEPGVRAIIFRPHVAKRPPEVATASSTHNDPCHRHSSSAVKC